MHGHHCVTDKASKAKQNKDSTYTLQWWDCIDPKQMGSADGYFQELDMTELEREELFICESLTAIFARKLLKQILALYGKVRG